MERVLFVDLDQVEPGWVWLTYRLRGELAAPPVKISVSELGNLHARAEADYYATLPEDLDVRARLLQEMGEILFSFLNRPERVLSHYLERTEGSADVLVLALTVKQRLAHLPWELLHDGRHFLVTGPFPVVPVRLVGGQAAPRPPRARDLRLLFMACAPTDLTAALDYEWEEARISEAVRGPASLDIREEPYGNLDELKWLIESYGADDFDVVHLTGHASHTVAGPRFLTETLVGGRLPASAHDLAKALRYRAPGLVFLSGCRTAEDADAGAVPSLARDLIERLTTPMVIGWGRPVVDRGAAEAAAILYGSLARGLSPAEALADTYGRLAERGVAYWHLLRMFVRLTDEQMPGPLVTAARSRDRDLPPRRRHDSAAGLSLPDARSFVDRKRNVQLALRSLDPSYPTPGKVGLVIQGLGGIGKTWLAGQVLRRIRESQPDGKLRLVGVGNSRAYLTENSLLDAIRDNAELGQALSDAQRSGGDLKSQLTRFLNRASSSVVFVIDEFEINFRPDPTARIESANQRQVRFERGRATLLPDAAATLVALVSALDDADQEHRLLITTRYLPELGCMRHLEVLHLTSLSESDVEKLVTRRSLERQLPRPVVQRIRELAGQNPRLLNWLFDNAVDNISLDDPLVREELRRKRESFLTEEIAADMLLGSRDPESLRLLKAAAPYRGHVSADVLARLTGAPRQATAGRADELVRLSLFEMTEDAAGVRRYGVPLVLETRFTDSDPDAERARYNAAARELAAEVKSFEPDDPRELDRAALSEINRLAVVARDADMVVRTAVALGNVALFHYRFPEALETGNRVITSYPDHRLYLILADAEAELGNAASSALYYERAIESCPEDEIGDRAAILASRSWFEETKDVALATDSALTAVDLAKRGGRPVTLAFAQRQAARMILIRQGAAAVTEARSHLADAAAAAEQLHDRGIEAASVRLYLASDVLLPYGDSEEAVREMATVNAVYERNGLYLHQAIALQEMASSWLGLGKPDQADELVQRARRITEAFPSMRIEAASDMLAGDIAFARSQLDDAVKLYERAARNAEDIGDVGRAALIWMRMARTYRRMGQREQAADAEAVASALFSQAHSVIGRIELLLAATEDDQGEDFGSRSLRAREAAALARSANAPYLELRAWTALVDMAYTQGSPTDDLVTILERLLELQRLVNPDDRAGRALTLHRLGSLLVDRQQYEEAQPFLDEARSMYAELADQEQNLGLVHRLLATVASTQERLEDATGHLRQSALLHHRVGDDAAAATALRELASVQATRRAAVPAPEQILRTALNLAREARAVGVEQQILEDLAVLARGRQADDWRAQALAAARRAEPVQLVVGQDIVEPFDPESGGIALSEIARVRGELQEEDDLTLPVVRLMDDLSLPRREYAIYFWGERVYQGSVLGNAARELPPDQLPSSADVTDEPGYLGRIEWIRSRRKRGEPAEAPLIDPATVAATNLKQLARRHRDLLTADRPPAVSYPVVEAMSLEELLGQF